MVRAGVSNASGMFDISGTMWLAGHFYSPYTGHPSAEDFVRFKKDPLIRFADELPDLYDGAP